MTQTSPLGCDVSVSLRCERVWCEIVVTPRIATPPPTGVDITSVNKHEVSPVVCLVGCPTCQSCALLVSPVVHLSFGRLTCLLGVPLAALLVPFAFD